MKLRNKENGEIYCNGIPAKPFCVVIGNGMKCYSSLAELNEEWEDCEEPETYYYISDCVNIESLTNDHGYNLPKEIWHKVIERRKEIGNYFETREEAEKAVEKLKAWKRLQDAGFRFTGISVKDGFRIHFGFFTDKESVVYGTNDDLDLLFGGEE